MDYRIFLKHTDKGEAALELSVHKQAGVGAYTIAQVYYINRSNGYMTKTFVMFQDFNKRIPESLVKAKRVTSKVEEQSLELAKAQLPAILEQVKAHYKWTD